MLKEQTGCKNQEVIRIAAFKLQPLARLALEHDSSGQPLPAVLSKAVSTTALNNAITLAGRQRNKSKSARRRNRMNRRANRQQNALLRNQKRSLAC